MTDKRTIQQNKALHKYFELLANKLAESGLDMRKVLKPEVEIPWTKEAVKECMYKPVMEAMFHVEHTSMLDTRQISQVYEVLNRHTAEKLGISVDWPSDEPPLV